MSIFSTFNISKTRCSLSYDSQLLILRRREARLLSKQLRKECDFSIHRICLRLEYWAQETSTFLHQRSIASTKKSKFSFITQDCNKSFKRSCDRWRDWEEDIKLKLKKADTVNSDDDDISSLLLITSSVSAISVAYSSSSSCNNSIKAWY